MAKNKDKNPEPKTQPDPKSGLSQGFRCALMSILAVLMLTVTVTSALAQAMPPSDFGDTSTFDKILEPVWKIYSFIKYIATAVAAIFLVIAGIIYMTAGNDLMKRDSAKHTITYVVVGLVVIWAAPFVVQLFV